MVAAILIAGGRAAYIVYERHEALKGDAEPKRETALNPDYYVNPKKLHAYDLKSAQALTAQPVVGEGRVSAYVLSVRSRSPQNRFRA